MKDSLNRFTVASVSLTSNANVLLLFDSHIWECNTNEIRMKEWEGLRSGRGVADNISGLVWVMECTSVLFIILLIPKKKEQPNKIQENKEGEPGNKRSQYKVRCFIVLTLIFWNQNKLRIHRLDIYRHFLLNHEVRA